jgi:hypothetical protein
MRPPLVVSSLLLLIFAATAGAQVQVNLKLKRLQYIAHEPVMATLEITNLAGRDIELRNEAGQQWFGFEVTGSEGQPVPPGTRGAPEPPLSVEAGKTVIRKIDLAPVYPIQDLGTYRVRANVYFADLNKHFYSQSRVFKVTDARPTWQKTVGVPEGTPGGGAVRTYSLMTNRFPTYTSLYVRVENRDTGVVYATYPLGRLIFFHEPQVEIDLSNELHVLHPAAPRTWSYAHVGLNGQLLNRQTILQTKSMPRLRRKPDGRVAVFGGMLDAPVAGKAAPHLPKLSTRPADPLDDPIEN